MKTNYRLGTMLGAVASILTLHGTADAATIYACKLNSLGTIRIVNASTNCSSYETKISWDAVGPQGPPGATGAQGIQGLQGIQGPQGLQGPAGAAGTGLVTDVANSNTYGGDGALSSITPSVGLGQGNEAVGQNALLSTTTGNTNSAFGLDALRSNTTGDGNQAFGTDALYHNDIGRFNSAFGYDALFSNTGAWGNSAFGSNALFFTTTGGENSAFGDGALSGNTTGSENSAVGHGASAGNTTGRYNSALGYAALGTNTTGWGNSAAGVGALSGVTTGNYNVGIGYYAGSNLTYGNLNIDIGNFGVADDENTIRIGTTGAQTKTYVAGISGVTTGSAGSAVVVDANGQLGTISSSRRYKEDIQPMGDASARLYQLRPVSFHYKTADRNGEKPLQYGLIAEDVAEVLPELVVPGKDGQPETVAYHLLPGLLLNELQKEHVDVIAQQQQLAAQDRQLSDMKAQVAELAALRAEVAELRGVMGQLVARLRGGPDEAGLVAVALPQNR